MDVELSGKYYLFDPFTSFHTIFDMKEGVYHVSKDKFHMIRLKNLEDLSGIADASRGFFTPSRYLLLIHSDDYHQYNISNPDISKAYEEFMPKASQFSFLMKLEKSFTEIEMYSHNNEIFNIIPLSYVI